MRLRRTFQSIRDLLGGTGKPLEVLELGTGVGLVSIALANGLQSSAVSFTLTDTEEARALAELNVQDQHRSESSMEFRELVWGQDHLPEVVAQRRFDVVLISDCIYNPDSSPALVKTINQLRAQNRQLRVLMAAKRRHDTESIFWQLLAKAGWTEQLVGSLATPDRHMETEETADELEDEPRVEVWLFSCGVEPSTAAEARPS